MRIDHAAIRRALRNTVGDALRRSGDDVDVRVAPVDGQPVPLDEATGQQGMAEITGTLEELLEAALDPAGRP